MSGRFDLPAARERAATIAKATRKGWSASTLRRLGVGLDTDGRYLIETATGVLRYADDGRKPKVLAERGMTRDLWPDPLDVPGEIAVLTEGEPDTISATELGLAAIAIPGVGKDDPSWPARIAAGRERVVLIPDADKVGRERMAALAAKLAPLVDTVVIELAADRTDGYDLGDLLADQGRRMARAQIDELLTYAVSVMPAPVAAPTLPVGDRRAVYTKASDVAIKRVLFLWRPYLPLGKLTILAGAPGQGKSQLTAMIAAMTTTGEFPDSDVTEPGTVVLMTAEDDPADTVVPRLIAAGADLSRVEFLNMQHTMREGLTADGLIKLPGDVGTLHERLKLGDVRLVVIDPVASFVGREHSTYRNQDVRDVLDPLTALAAKYGCAFVAILHLNKSDAKSWAARIGESHAFQAVARTVLALAPDPDDEDGEHGTDKILAPTKLNIARAVVRGVRLRVRSVTVYDAAGDPIETSVIDPLGPSMIAADDLLSDAAEHSARRDAIAFLLGVLQGGPMESQALKAGAKSASVSWRSIERYYREVCKPAKPAKGQGPWMYELQSGHAAIHTPGGLGGHTPKSANSPGGVYSGEGETTPKTGPNGGLGGPRIVDLEAYRREERRRLGEREDD